MTRMKESGIDWIGQIPEEWEVIKVKFFTYMKGRIGWQGLKADEFIDEGPYLVTGTDFKNGRVNWDTAYHISQKRYEQAPEIQLKQGDLLVTKDGTVGKLALIDELPDSASLNSHLLVLRPLFNRYDNHFLYYVLSSLEFKNYFQKVSIGSTMDSLSQEKMGEFIFALPNINEQNSISRYLDKKTAQLDKAKALLEEQIQKLKDYRASLIYETVTKGLDKNIPMKDSGIDWIGKVPQGWGVSKLKNLLKIKDGTHDTPSYVDSGIPLITTKNINSFSNYIDFSTAKNISYKDYILINRRSDVEYGDILMPMIGTVGGAVQVTTKNSFSIKNVALFKAGFDLIMSKYLYYQLNSDIVNNQLEFLMSGGVQSFVSISILEQLQIINPSEKDKKKIVRFLDEKTQKIDKLIQIKNQQIENINKQRQTLIYDYVTGKRRV